MQQISATKQAAIMLLVILVLLLASVKITLDTRSLGPAGAQSEGPYLNNVN